ncbi:MAG: DUF5711 family protein [Clostridia bacterium]|nr:DUF5711 family protein [Clostridia bacterium]
MTEKKRAGSRIRLLLLVLLLAIFAFVGVCQIYEAMSERDTASRVVLGMDSVQGEFSGGSLVGNPAPMGEYIAIVSGGTFMTVNSDGENVTDDVFSLSDPIIKESGDFAAVGDYGGTKVHLYENGKLVTEIEAEGEIITLATNSSGCFAAATEQRGYDAVITVYRKNGEAIYRYTISDKSFVDMAVSENNRYLLITAANAEAGDAGSTLTLAQINKSDSVKVYNIRSNVYFAVHFNKNGTFVCLGSTGIDIYRTDGVKTASITYEGRKLTAADVSKDNMITLAFAASDSSGVVEIYGKAGKLRGTAEFDESVENVCVNGNYIAVAHGETVDIIKANGKIKTTLDASSTVKYAAPFKNGNAALVFAGGSTEILKG